MNGVKTMKTILLLIFAFIPAVSLAGTEIEVTPDSFDFGKTYQHVKVTHTFWVKSVGNAILRIEKVIPGCGCTRAPLMDSVLAPGDSTALEITFATKSFMGNINKTPRLITNAAKGKTSIGISAEVLIKPEQYAPLRLTPYKIDISSDTAQSRRHAVFLIENRGEADLKLTLIDQPADYFEATLPDIIKAGETAEALVVVIPEMTAEFEKSFTFEIDDDNRTRYSVPVTRLLLMTDDKQD